MKFVFLAGGFVGFVVGGGASLVTDHEPGRVFLDAALGCLAGAMLFRWFWNVVVRGIRETLEARDEAQASAEAAAAASTPAKTKALSK